MHISWNEIRLRASQFAEEWKDAHYERGESQTFYNEFSSSLLRASSWWTGIPLTVASILSRIVSQGATVSRT